jgi:DNA-binding response OmpR family regulator
MISADTNADKVSQCIELGADDYLAKPFNPTILRGRSDWHAQVRLRRLGRYR